MFVLQKADGQYVARKGREHTYTAQLERAWQFADSGEAERNRRVETEAVVPISSLLTGYITRRLA